MNATFLFLFLSKQPIQRRDTNGRRRSSTENNPNLARLLHTSRKFTGFVPGGGGWRLLEGRKEGRKEGRSHRIAESQCTEGGVIGNSSLEILSDVLSSPRAGVRRWLTMTSTIKYARWNTQGDRKTRSPLNYALSFIMKRPILSLKFSSKWGEGDRISKQKENFVSFILRKGILGVVFLFFSGSILILFFFSDFGKNCMEKLKRIFRIKFSSNMVCEKERKCVRNFFSSFIIFWKYSRSTYVH